MLLGIVFAAHQAAASGNIVLNVSVNTSTLATSPGPYGLYFQLADNSENLAGNSNSLVVVDQFGFGGGDAGPGPAQSQGGATGDLRVPGAQIQFIDTAFINSFSQSFVPGTNLTFRVSLNANRLSPGPDAFSISVLGTNGMPIPTESRVDELIRADLDEKRPALKVYRSDLAHTVHDIPAPGVDILIVTNTPAFTLVPGIISATNSSFQMDFPGAKLADLFELQASTDLRNWTNLGRRAYFGTPIIFSDPGRTNYASRFYRVRFVNP